MFSIVCDFQTSQTDNSGHGTMCLKEELSVQLVNRALMEFFQLSFARVTTSEATGRRAQSRAPVVSIATVQFIVHHWTVGVKSSLRIRAEIS